MASERHSTQSQQDKDRRVLRIGVVLGGKIVEEKLIRERTSVTIGQSAKNTFAVPLEGLPRTWPLFTIHNDKYELHFSDAMDGRMSDGGEVRTLEAIKGNKARKQGDAWVLPLSDEARGKIVVGDMTLLFQFVNEPPRQPQPHLPASLRGTLADRIDPVLSVVLAISLLLHFSIALYAYQRDRVVRTRTTRVFNETFQRPTVAAADLEFEVPKEPTAETPTDKKEEKPVEQGNKSESKPSNKPRGEREPGSGGRSEEEALRLEEEAIAFANNLLSDDFSNSGIGGGSSDRDPKNDLGEAIAAVRRSGARVEVGGGSSRGPRGSSQTEIGTGQGPQVEGPGETTTRTEDKVTERVPQGRIKVGDSSSLDDTTLKPDDVLRKIQTVYMNGLKRCHKDLLKRDPSAGGRVNLRFTVGETGRVVRVTAEGFDQGVDRCIEGQAQTWRFGVPTDEDGEPTDASFKISLVLQPD